MSFEVFITSDFKRESKSLIKKYKSLKTEFFDLITALEENPAKGIMTVTKYGWPSSPKEKANQVVLE